MLKTLTFTTAILGAFALQAEEQTPAGRALAIEGFEQLDEAGRGFLDRGQIYTYSDQIFAAVDYDEDSKLTFEEFNTFDTGFKLIAEEEGKIERYNTAMKVMFAFWDRNGDGVISRTDFTNAINADFDRSDNDGDGFLSKEEFLGNFGPMVAVRAALKDD